MPARPGPHLDWRMRLLTRVTRALPPPDPPTPRYLASRRNELPRLLRRLLGPRHRDVAVHDEVAPVRGGTLLALRVYRPCRESAKLPYPLVVAFHGGGFVFGSLGEMDWLCGQVAGRVEAVVVSVGYRMAPEHPAPGPFEDCWDAVHWVLGHADRWSADPTRTTVLGTSAGGNLAALVAIAHRDAVRADPGLVPLAGQVLLYPATDLTLSSPSLEEFAEDPFLSREVIFWFGRQYVPQDRPNSIALDDPRISPFHAADHTGLAPALIVVGGRDPLRDDGTRYAEVLAAAGVPVRLELHPDAIHGFMALPRLFRAAHLGADQVVSFLSR